MNQCILMAEVIQPPQLRHTQDSQTAIAEMIVQFPGIRPDDPPGRLKVVGWGNMAQLVHEGCKVGDRLVLEGRLRINTVERPEGFKDKVVEFTVNRFHALNGGDFVTSGGIGMGAPNQAPMGGAGYGAPAAVPGYGAPAAVPGYGAPAAGYGAPAGAPPRQAPPAPARRPPETTVSPSQTYSAPVVEPNYDEIPF
jgi:single-strand DNA-binding protein